MSDYIKREDILDRTTKRNSIWNGITNACGQGLEEIVNGIPSADVAPVRHGKWIEETQDIFGNGELFGSGYVCSECGRGDGDIHKYCPYCGAKMDEGGSNGTDNK